MKLSVIERMVVLNIFLPQKGKDLMESFRINELRKLLVIKSEELKGIEYKETILDGQPRQNWNEDKDKSSEVDYSEIGVIDIALFLEKLKEWEKKKEVPTDDITLELVKRFQAFGKEVK